MSKNAIATTNSNAATAKINQLNQFNQFNQFKGELLRGRVDTAFCIATLAAYMDGRVHKTEDIIPVILDDYLDPLCEEKARQLQSGGTAADKYIRWAIQLLYEVGLLQRYYNGKRGCHRITEQGMNFLRGLVYFLDSYLERDLDQTGVISGYAYRKIHVMDPEGKFGASREAAKVRQLLAAFAAGGGNA